MLNSQKISKNLNKIQKLWNEKGAYTVLKKGIHLSTKKLGQTPAKRTVVKRDSLLNGLDKDILRQELEHAFSSGLFRSTSEIKKCVHQIPDELAELILEEATRTLKNEFYLYGNLKVSYGPDQFSWLRDPLTGFTWPKTMLDNHDSLQKAYGTDIKTVWEIARFHFLSSLAYAYILTGEEKYVQFAVNKVSSWIDENPFLHRPHWLMPMECTIRIINWCVYLPLLNIKNYTNLAFRNKLSQSIFEHLVYIRYNLECSPSQAGNHYLTDLVGLIAAKLIFPSSEWANDCTEFAVQEFQNEVDRQFKEKGIYFQGSLPYHRLGSEILLVGIALTQKNGFNIRKKILDRIRQVASFTKYYSDVCEKTPIIGDNDNGIFLKYFPGQESTNHRYLNCLFNCILGGESEAKNFFEFLCCCHFSETSLPKSTDSGSHQNTGDSKLQVKEFDGLIIARNDSENIFFNTLNSSQGHAHNDKLSIYPVIAGNLLFIDRGSFSYSGSRQKRHQDRISSSHNGPFINNWEQNKIWKDDLYYNNGDAKSFSTIEQNAENLLITGWHIGYNRYRRGLKVFRKIHWNTYKRFISISDWIEGTSSNELFLYQLNFLINPIWTTKTTDSGFIFAYQEEAVHFEDLDCIGFELTQSCFCPSYQLEKKCEAIKASKEIKVGDILRLRLRY